MRAAEKYIGGNRCEKPITRKNAGESLNIYEYKLKLLEEYRSCEGPRGTIGIPMGLNMYELLPFWYRFFKDLGFGVKRRLCPIPSCICGASIPFPAIRFVSRRS